MIETQNEITNLLLDYFEQKKGLFFMQNRGMWFVGRREDGVTNPLFGAHSYIKALDFALNYEPSNEWNMTGGGKE